MDDIKVCTIHSYNNCTAGINHPTCFIRFVVEKVPEKGTDIDIYLHDNCKPGPGVKISCENWNTIVNETCYPDRRVIWQFGTFGNWLEYLHPVSLMLEILYRAKNKVTFNHLGFGVNNFIPCNIFKYQFVNKSGNNFEVQIDLENAVQTTTNITTKLFTRCDIRRIIIDK